MKSLIVLLLIASFSTAAVTNEELQRKIEILAEEIQDLKANQMQIGTNQSMYGFGPSASKVYQIRKGVSIGGYGELVFNKKMQEDENGNKVVSDATSEVIRNILYVGYKFNSQWVLNTEIEIEHINEIYAEFAYLDYLHSQELSFRAGLLLLPMGIVNEKHEPTTFNSVNRPNVEKYIVPSTWRENGFGVFGSKDNWSYRAYVINGMNGDEFSAKNGLRGGRKKGGSTSSTSPNPNQNSSTTALTGRFDYAIGSNGTIGGAFYTGTASSLANQSIGVTMLQAHSEIFHKNWEFKFLYVNAALDSVERNTAAMTDNTAEEMEGMYFEVAYDLWANNMNKSLKPFIRYEKYNTQKAMPTGKTAQKQYDVTDLVVGVAYLPIDRIVFKADYTFRSNGADTGVDEINVGLGYNF